MERASSPPPAKIGKVEVRKYGASVELYVKASDPSASLAKGRRVRIADCGEEYYYAEPIPVATGDKET